MPPERELRGIALGRKSWLFAGSDRGGERTAVMLTLIHTAKLNDVDPQAWLSDVLGSINDHNIHRLNELLPWNWASERKRRKLAASVPTPSPVSRSRSMLSSPRFYAASRCRSTSGSTGCT